MLKKKIIIYTFIIGLISSCAVAKEQKKEEDISTYELLNIFGEVMERTKASYVEDVSDKKLIESAINGMLTSLDPHSSYLNAEDFKYMNEQTSGKFGGLGIEITMEKEALDAYDASEPHHEWKKNYAALIEKKTIFDSED